MKTVVCRAIIVVGVAGAVSLVSAFSVAHARAASLSPAAFAPPSLSQPVLRSLPLPLTGRWRMTLEMEVGRATPLLDLLETEGKLTGSYTGRYGSAPVSGTVDGTQVAFAVAMESTTLRFKGELQEDGTLKGTADFGDMGAVRWTAKREH